MLIKPVELGKFRDFIMSIIWISLTLLFTYVFLIPHSSEAGQLDIGTCEYVPKNKSASILFSIDRDENSDESLVTPDEVEMVSDPSSCKTVPATMEDLMPEFENQFAGSRCELHPKAPSNTGFPGVVADPETGGVTMISEACIASSDPLFLSNKETFPGLTELSVMMIVEGQRVVGNHMSFKHKCGVKVTLTPIQGMEKSMLENSTFLTSIARVNGVTYIVPGTYNVTRYLPIEDIAHLARGLDENVSAEFDPNEFPDCLVDALEDRDTQNGKEIYGLITDSFQFWGRTVQLSRRAKRMEAAAENYDRVSLVKSTHQK